MFLRKRKVLENKDFFIQEKSYLDTFIINNVLLDIKGCCTTKLEKKKFRMFFIHKY